MADHEISALFEQAQAAAEKTCDVCGVPLIPKRGRTKFCSRACSRVVENQKRNEARWAGVVKKLGDIIQCGLCGVDIAFKGRRHIYCTDCFAIRENLKSKEWVERNPEKAKEIRLVAASKRKDNPDYIAWRTKYFREYTTNKRKNPRHRLDHRMGQLMRGSLVGKGGRTWESLVGYSIDDLFIHLEKQFLPGMSWENMSDWHIDHILPRAMFNYETEYDPDFRVCWSLTNLRPIWAEENIKKGSNRLHLV